MVFVTGRLSFDGSRSPRFRSASGGRSIEIPRSIGASREDWGFPDPPEMIMARERPDIAPSRSVLERERGGRLLACYGAALF